MLAYIDRVETLSPADRKRLCQAAQFCAQAENASESAKYKDAIAIGTKAWEIEKQLFGEDNWDSLTAEAWLGYYYREDNDLDKAETILKQVLQKRQAILGPDDPDIGLSNNSLGHVYDLKKEYAEAEPLFRRAVEIYRNAQGPDGLDYAQSLDNLAELYTRRKDYRRAEACAARSCRFTSEHRVKTIPIRQRHSSCSPSSTPTCINSTRRSPCSTKLKRS